MTVRASSGLLFDSEWEPSGTGSIKKTTFSDFDPFGRPLTITPPDGSAHNVTIAYTGERRVERTAKVGTTRTGSVVNETSVTTTDLYDGVGRLWKRTEPSSPSGTDVTTVHTYDAFGRLRNASTTSGVTQVRDWSHDGRGFLLTETVPEKGGTGGYGTVSYSSYDVRGQAGRVIDGPNDLSSSFDDAGRLISVTETGTGKVVRSLTYGTANTTGNLANGKLTVAEAGNFYDGTNNFQFRETYTYGGTDGRVSQRVTLGGIEGVNQGTFTLGYTWSPLGDVATVTYPQKAGVGAARTVTNTYSNGFLTNVAQGATNFASSISYHTNATVNRVTYGNNVWVDHAKDLNDMARPAGISLGNATSSWSTGTYGYDGTGNIITMTGTSTTDTFVYDKVSRIKEARQTVGGLVKTQAYAYDSFGNLSTITTNGTPRTLAVDALTSRISGSGYDAAGSMTSWGSGGTTYSYSYYPTNEMKQMVGDGRTTLHGYSADGERVGTWDSVTGGITYVLRGLDNKPLRQYREFNGGWTWQKDWVYRDGLVLATVDSTGTKYLHLDHLGTPRRITNSSRAVIASHDYYPFGEEITASSQDAEALKFTGHERDLRDPTKTTDDLDYMHARFYNPTIARFLSTDPIGGDAYVPRTWNAYAYALDSPVNFTDPLGLFEVALSYDWTQGNVQMLYQNRRLADEVAGFFSSYEMYRNRGNTFARPIWGDEWLVWTLNASAGVADSLLFGLGEPIRGALGSGGVVDRSSSAYSAGEGAAFLVGSGRLIYAGMAKGLNVLRFATSLSMFDRARMMSGGRNVLKRVFSLGMTPDSRWKTWSQISREKRGNLPAIMSAATQTHPRFNLMGAYAAGGATVNELGRAQ